jgi:chitinase
LPIRNQLPLVALTSPTNNEAFLAPSRLTLAASASDLDGSVARVEFFGDGSKLGEATNSPYTVEWLSALGHKFGDVFLNSGCQR